VAAARRARHRPRRLLPEDDDGASLAALGRRMGVTGERVRQIEVGLKGELCGR
jgi:DNA-directed RNA polymerase sigma subunit (sigma70/sigma32)